MACSFIFRWTDSYQYRMTCLFGLSTITTITLQSQAIQHLKSLICITISIVIVGFSFVASLWLVDHCHDHFIVLPRMRSILMPVLMLMMLCCGKAALHIIAGQLNEDQIKASFGRP